MSIKLDAAESAFLDQQLEQVRSSTYDVKYPNLKAREYLPVDNSLDPGTETVVYYQFDSVGSAKMIASYADDLPRADVFANRFTSNVKSLGNSFGYSVQEIRAARKAGLDLDARKAQAARRAMEEKLDELARSGDAASGLQGFFDISGALTYTVPADGTGGSDDWSSKDADLVIRDLNGMVNYIVSQTKEVEAPDTLLLPLTAYQEIATRRMGDGSDQTILNFFLATNPYVRTVSPWWRLETAGTGGIRKAIAYRRDPEALQLLVPQEFEMFAPETRGLEMLTACHMRCGGVVAYYPLSICYAEGF